MRQSTGPLQLGATLDFMRLLWALDHALQSRSKRMDAELGVTGLQRLVLRLAGRFPEISAGELAELLHVHPSTLTGVLKRLVARGDIKRESDPEDARRARFELTHRGLQLDAHQSGTVEVAVRRALARLSPEKVNAAREVLLMLTQELEREDR
jgi:DNA-binding MarR family transcriptional regulator